ncbi:MAG: tetratricopeptide repeat protein [Bacteroidia bacterium]|nr:tetratricopeptide repeat protein [Bacteroidia bacterium]
MQNAETCFQQGNDLLNEARYEEAVAAFTQAIALRPDFEAAYAQRAIARYELNDQQGALTDWGRASEIYYLSTREAPQAEAVAQPQPINQQVQQCWLIGNQAFANQQYEEALGYYDQALALDPLADARIYYNRGRSNAKLENYPEALSDYQQAIDLNPDYVKAYLESALVLAILEQHDEAIAYYSQVIRKQANPAAAFFFRGRSYAPRSVMNKPIRILTKPYSSILPLPRLF